jgi:serine/threonine-protein kinase
VRAQIVKRATVGGLLALLAAGTTALGGPAVDRAPAPAAAAQIAPASLAPGGASIVLAGTGGALLLGALGWGLRRARGGGAQPRARRRRADRRPPAATPQAEPADARPRLGSYLLLDQLGEGGMAEVFTAVSLARGAARRPLVIKRVRAAAARDRAIVEPFLAEAKITACLDHPNVARVVDHGEEDGLAFLAEEYLPARDLGRLTRRMIARKERPLSPAAILHVAHEVLAALEHAHDARDAAGAPLELVHRDVTPENVLLTPTGEVRLIDFGIAKVRGGEGLHADGGAVKGNVDFMAPEQARGRPVDRRADLFSLGLVIYFCAARAPLYRGKTLEDRIVRAATGPGTPELGLVEGLPAPLPAILGEVLAVDPARRPATAAALRARLAPHVEGGAAEIAAAVRRHFGDELAAEEARLDAALARSPAPGRAAKRGGARGRAERPLAEARS